MVLSDQRTPYSIMYVWAAFEAKSPTRQDLVTLIILLIITHCNLESIAFMSPPVHEDL